MSKRVTIPKRKDGQTWYFAIFTDRLEFQHREIIGHIVGKWYNRFSDAEREFFRLTAEDPSFPSKHRIHAVLRNENSD